MEHHIMDRSKLQALANELAKDLKTPEDLNKNWPHKFEHPDKWNLCYFDRPYRPESRGRKWQDDQDVPTHPN